MSSDHTPSNERDQVGRTGEPYVYPHVEATNPGGPSPMPGGPNPVPGSEVDQPVVRHVPVDDPSPNPGGPDPEPGGSNPVE